MATLSSAVFGVLSHEAEMTLESSIKPWGGHRTTPPPPTVNELSVGLVQGGGGTNSQQLPTLFFIQTYKD